MHARFKLTRPVPNQVLCIPGLIIGIFARYVTNRPDSVKTSSLHLSCSHNFTNQTSPKKITIAVNGKNMTYQFVGDEDDIACQREEFDADLKKVFLPLFIQKV